MHTYMHIYNYTLAPAEYTITHVTQRAMNGAAPLSIHTYICV